MKKVLFFLVAACPALFSPAVLKADSFTVVSDTVWANYGNTTLVLHNDITNTGTLPLTLKWHVISTTFPSDWLTSAAFSMCDNDYCRPNTSGLLWNETTSSGNFFNCDYPVGSPGTFDLTLDLAHATTGGSHMVSAFVTDTATHFSKTLTFVINRIPASVTNVSAGIDDFNVFPNPASSEAFIQFDLKSKSMAEVAVYDMLGRVVHAIPAMEMAAGANRIKISTADFAPGLYTIKMQTDRGTISRRLVISN